MINRRVFLNRGVTAFAAASTGLVLDSVGAETRSYGANEIVLDPRPLFDLSPYLYMQFMEPLGKTDGSVAAGWDDRASCWRSDLVEVTRQLGPPMMRWGGCFSSYYRWREGVGPRAKRTPMHNLLWGGMESNQVGTLEFVDFCRQVGAEPLMCVNFESDGRKRWMRDLCDSVRTAGPDEAAEWVDYCNNPANALRRAHGGVEPSRIGFWQIGNETSYDKHGFDLETAALKTVQFAKAMRRVDPSVKLVGWGDSGWARRMIEVAGEHLHFIAFHHMYNPGAKNKASVLRDYEYRKDPSATWAELMDAWKPHEARILEMRQQVEGTGIPLALTECHLTLRGPNRCEVLSSWAAGVAMARLLNLHSRHGDVLKIATAADFCGTSWQVNAVMIPVMPSRNKAFMQPVARVMSLLRHHVGTQAVRVARCPEGLDVTASRSGNRFFLHVINTNRDRPVEVQFRIDGMAAKRGGRLGQTPESQVERPREHETPTGFGTTCKVYGIATDPTFEIRECPPDPLSPVEKSLPTSRPWQVPPASVSAVELQAIT